MNSSKPCVEQSVLKPTKHDSKAVLYPDFPFYPNTKLLVQPYGHRRALLKQTEDKVDWWQEDLAALTAAAVSARHVEGGRTVAVGSGGVVEYFVMLRRDLELSSDFGQSSTLAFC